METKQKKIYRIKNIVFFAVLGVLAVIGTMWFLRPHVSEIEKRELTPFPDPTLTGVLDGSFAKDLGQWYSDTYPLREQLISGAHLIQSLYGNRSEQIIIKDNPADEIPDVPGGDDPQGGAAPASAEPSEKPSEAPSAEPTAAPPTSTPVPTPDSTPEPTLPDGTISTPGEVMGTIYVAGDSAYSLYYFSEAGATRYANFINRAHQALGDDVQIYSISIPLSSGVMLDQSLMDDVGASDQRAAIEYMNSLMEPGVHGLNIYDTMKQHNSQYIYFRTDHHWTALGAYYAYVELCREKGVTPHTLDQFEQKNFEGFLGTFYSETRSDAMAANPDTVTAYVPMGTNSMTFVGHDGAEYSWNIISDVESSGSGSKYYCFSGSDQPYSYVHNPQITDGSACVVIKDSFGNAFVPFMVDHYEYTYWIDFRYYGGTLPDLVREKGIGDVIFCLNMYNTSSEGAVSLLEDLVPYIEPVT